MMTVANMNMLRTVILSKTNKTMKNLVRTRKMTTTMMSQSSRNRKKMRMMMTRTKRRKTTMMKNTATTDHTMIAINFLQKSLNFLRI